jgi:hypothetical protein
LIASSAFMIVPLAVAFSMAAFVGSIDSIVAVKTVFYSWESQIILLTRIIHICGDTKLSRHCMSNIGILNEKPLHAALKKWYARPGDQFEVSVDGFVVDIVRGNLLIEIQTGNFASIKRKVHALAVNHILRLVYPIAREKWILRLARNGSSVPSRRRSPKRGALELLFKELVSYPKLMANPNFSIEVLFIREEEVRCYDGRRGWRRRGWITKERRLIDVIDREVFEGPKDLLGLIPPDLIEPWTTEDLSLAIGQPRWLVQKIVYCLREIGVAKVVGKKGNAILYAT